MAVLSWDALGQVKFAVPPWLFLNIPLPRTRRSAALSADFGGACGVDEMGDSQSLSACTDQLIES